MRSQLISHVNTHQSYLRKRKQARSITFLTNQQGRIHGIPVANGWAGAVMRKPLAIQQYIRTNGSTNTARLNQLRFPIC